MENQEPLAPDDIQERRQTLQTAYCAAFYGVPALLLLFSFGPFSPEEWADLQSQMSTKSSVASIRRESQERLSTQKARMDAGFAELQLRAIQREKTLDCAPVVITFRDKPLDLPLQPTMEKIAVPLNEFGQPAYPIGACVKTSNGATGISDGRYITDILPPAPPTDEAREGASSPEIAKSE